MACSPVSVVGSPLSWFVVFNYLHRRDIFRNLQSCVLPSVIHISSIAINNLLSCLYRRLRPPNTRLFAVHTSNITRRL
jgi:hypothetical protein